MPPTKDTLFESLYAEYFGKLTYQAYSVLKNMAVAEELVQDAFCTAWQKREAPNFRKNPVGYLKKILNFKISEYKRARDRDLRIFRSLESSPLPEARAPFNPIPISTATILETARNMLTDTEWYIFEQFSLQGASHHQIAKALGITPQASQKRLGRIRKKLEDAFPDH